MVDFTTNEDVAVDPPLAESEAPLMGNPVLMRDTKPVRRSSAASGSKTAWYIGVPVAVLLLGGAAFYVATQNAHQNDLLTNTATTSPPAEQASIAAPTVAPMAPAAVPGPSPVAKTPEPAMTPVQPTHAPRFASAEPRATHRTVRSVRAARSANENTADTAAVAPSAPMAAPATVAPARSPTLVEPSAPPVITPPAPVQ